MFKQQNPLVIISGLSGAGRTTTLNVFEDMGYKVMYGLPLNLFKDYCCCLDPICDEEKQTIVGMDLIDVLTCYYEDWFQPFISQLVLLNCDHMSLLKRYRSIRRVHPLSLIYPDLDLESALALERQWFSELLNKLDTDAILIDTTNLSKNNLINYLEKVFINSFDYNSLIQVMSFGFKFGVPLQADYVFDVRFLDNPYWDSKLRQLTGLDQAVYDFVLNDKKTSLFLTSLYAFLMDIVEANLNMDRSLLTIAIGCTGGQHRSVVITRLIKQFLDEKFRNQKINVSEIHRDCLYNQEMVRREKI